MDKHLNTPLPSLSEHCAQLPAALDEVLQTATAKDPAQRCANTPRFAAAFRAALPSLSPRLAHQPLADPLTERELDVLRLMIVDLTNEQIAERLVLSPATVKWFVKQIYHKLDSHSRHQANFQRAEAQRLAAEANRLLLKQGSGTLAGLLALRSLNLVYTPEGDEALNGALMLDYPVQEFVGHTDRVKAVDFSPDGRYVLTGSGDSTMRLWDAQTGQEIRQFSGDMQDINTAAFSPDGQQIITGSRHDQTVRIWDVETGEELRRFTQGNSGSFSLDGRHIFTFSEDDTHSTMIDLATGDVVATIALPQVARCPEQSGFSPDGTLYADIPDTGDALTVTIRKVNSGEAILSFPLPLDYNNLDFSNDNHYFLITNGEDNSILVWDLVAGDLLHTLTGHSEPVISAVFSADSKQIASGGDDRTVRVWDVQTGQEVRHFNGHTEAVRIVTFSSDGRYVLSGGFDQQALLWEIAPSGGPPLLVEENSGIRDLAFTPNGSRIAAVKDNGQTVLWDARTGEISQTLQIDDQPIYFVEFTPDGNLLITSTFDDITRVWDVNRGEMLYELPPASIGYFPR